MKAWWMGVLLLAHSVVADEVPQLQNPLLPLSQEIPLELSEENRRLLAAIQEQQPARNQQLAERHAFPWMGGLVFLLMGGFWVLMQGVSLEPRPLTPEQRTKRARRHAQRRLATLDREKLSDAQRYEALAELVRRFIEERYQVHAQRQTTPEFLHAITTYLEFTNTTREQLAQFLICADRVKFARYEPSVKECAAAHRCVEQVIN